MYNLIVSTKLSQILNLYFLNKRHVNNELIKLIIEKKISIEATFPKVEDEKLKCYFNLNILSPEISDQFIKEVILKINGVEGFYQKPSEELPELL